MILVHEKILLAKNLFSNNYPNPNKPLVRNRESIANPLFKMKNGFEDNCTRSLKWNTVYHEKRLMHTTYVLLISCEIIVKRF